MFFEGHRRLSANFVTKYTGHAGGKERGGRGGKERNMKSQE
jgi:hypothetical protein